MDTLLDPSLQPVLLVAAEVLAENWLPTLRNGKAAVSLPRPAATRARAWATPWAISGRLARRSGPPAAASAMIPAKFGCSARGFLSQSLDGSHQLLTLCSYKGDALVVPLGNVGRCVITKQNPDTGETDLDTLNGLADYRGDIEAVRVAHLHRPCDRLQPVGHRAIPLGPPGRTLPRPAGPMASHQQARRPHTSHQRAISLMD